MVQLLLVAYIVYSMLSDWLILGQYSPVVSGLYGENLIP